MVRCNFSQLFQLKNLFQHGMNLQETLIIPPLYQTKPRLIHHPFVLFFFLNHFIKLIVTRLQIEGEKERERNQERKVILLGLGECVSSSSSTSYVEQQQQQEIRLLFRDQISILFIEASIREREQTDKRREDNLLQKTNVLSLVLERLKIHFLSIELQTKRLSSLEISIDQETIEQQLINLYKLSSLSCFFALQS